MERGSRKRSSSAGSEKLERVGGRHGRTLFDRPKPTVGCSANGRSIISYPQYKETVDFSIASFSIYQTARCHKQETYNFVCISNCKPLLSLRLRSRVSTAKRCCVLCNRIPFASTSMDGKEKPRGLSAGYKPSGNDANRFANCIFKLLPLPVMILHS